MKRCFTDVSATFGVKQHFIEESDEYKTILMSKMGSGRNKEALQRVAILRKLNLLKLIMEKMKHS